MPYPADYHNAALAGKTATFDVHVKKVEEKTLPELDEEFCREYGVDEGGVEQLRREVRDNMERELGENIRARLKQQLLDGLLAANPVDVPQSLVDAQVREMQIEAARRMGARDASQVPPPEPFVEAARKRVALGLLVGELIKRPWHQARPRAASMRAWQTSPPRYPEPDIDHQGLSPECRCAAPGREPRARGPGRRPAARARQGHGRSRRRSRI